MRVILASASPRRKEILSRICPVFSVEPARCGEEVEGEPAPEELTLLLARRKAEEVASHFPDAAVLAADTVVWFEGRALGKPKDAADAAATLSLLSGREHAVYTGWCLLSPKGGRCGVCRTEVTFRELDAAFIAAYVASGNPLDKAGSYGIQDEPSPVLRYRGSLTNVIGLPQEEIARAFQEIGVLV